ncbi:MAG: hypothetical protein LBE14_05620 [Treponema sp.]|jgi:hypothetical protein|nr:hypothetical protein [Treponema sp.]
MNGKMTKVFFIMCISIFFVFSACDASWEETWGPDYEYKFDNQTQYSITVTLNKNYKLSKEGGEESRELNLSSKSSRTVYIKSDSVDFKWAASYYNSSYSRYIYPVTDGSKVTFKERAK